MRIWVDADACPKAIKEIIFRAAIRTQTEAILVANRPLFIPKSPFIKIVQVPGGFDEADSRIIREMEKDDIVITADIPLADSVVNKEGTAIDPKGKLYTRDNIKQTLSFRNLNAELRGAGLISGGPSEFGAKECQAFANCLDKILASRRGK